MKTVVYDLAGQPATYDIVPFLATANAMAGGQFRVVILADQFRDKSEKDRALSDAQKSARVRNMIAPCCRLVPNAVRVDVVKSRAEADGWRAGVAIKPGTFIASANNQWSHGREVQCLRAPRPSQHPGSVVMTIRQSTAVPAKNSNTDAWLEAAAVIMASGHKVVLIPDTEMVGRPLPDGFNWSEEAAGSVDVRAALYQEALCCLSMGLGPMSIAMFMKGTQYAVFVDHPRVENNRQIFERVWGIRWGQQLPFSGPGQIIDYHPETASAIVDAFHKIQGQSAA